MWEIVEMIGKTPQACCTTPSINLPPSLASSSCQGSYHSTSVLSDTQFEVSVMCLEKGDSQVRI